MAGSSAGSLAIITLSTLSLAPLTSSGAKAEGFGTQDSFVSYLTATTFASANDAERVIFGNDGSFWSSNPLAGPLLAQVEVPEGALITDIFVYVTDIDTDVGADVSATLCLAGRGYIDGQPATSFCFPAASSAAIQGNGQIQLPINATFSHLFDLDNDQDLDAVVWLLHLDNLASSRIAFAAEVHWRRQVVPPPAQATFDDVPLDHPLRPYVEAFYAAGIASTCGQAPLRFCPDDPVTRGQMAAFFAKALGLHWDALP